MAQQSPNQPQQLPSETVRGLVSLFLVIHLFGVAIALMAYTAASAMQLRLLDTMAPYLRTFNFDLAHANVYFAPSRLFLTHASAMDIDFVIEGEATLPTGKTNWRLPEPGLWPRTRFMRQQNLVNIAGGLAVREGADDDSATSVLPKAIAAAEFAKSAARSGKLDLNYNLLQSIDDLNSSDPSRRDPLDKLHFRTAFQRQVIAGPMGLDLLKSTAVGEAAPVTGAGPATGSPAVKTNKD